jgi:hypothetical protein
MNKLEGIAKNGKPNKPHYPFLIPNCKKGCDNAIALGIFAAGNQQHERIYI